MFTKAAVEIGGFPHGTFRFPRPSGLRAVTGGLFTALRGDRSSGVASRRRSSWIGTGANRPTRGLGGGLQRGRGPNGIAARRDGGRACRRTTRRIAGHDQRPKGRSAPARHPGCPGPVERDHGTGRRPAGLPRRPARIATAGRAPSRTPRAAHAARLHTNPADEARSMPASRGSTGIGVAGPLRTAAVPRPAPPASHVRRTMRRFRGHKSAQPHRHRQHPKRRGPAPPCGPETKPRGP